MGQESTQQQQGQQQGTQEGGQQQNGTPPEGQQQQQGQQQHSDWFESLPPEAQAEIRKLRGESASYRTRAQTAEQTLAEKEREQMSEAERAKAEAEDAKKDAAEARRKLLKYEVAAEKKVPTEALDLLHGDTKEELEAAADKLLALIGGQEQGGNGGRQQLPDLGQGYRGNGSGEPLTMNQLIRQTAGRG